MCCRAQVRLHIQGDRSSSRESGKALLGVCGKSPLPQPGEEPPPENTKGRRIPERSRRQRECAALHLQDEMTDKLNR